MEYEKIKELMDEMSNSKLTNLDITLPDGTKIAMQKENMNAKNANINDIISASCINQSANLNQGNYLEQGKNQFMNQNQNINQSQNVNQNSDQGQVANLNFENLENSGKNQEQKSNEKIVKSPMVGTFYLKPSPDAQNFVNVRQEVKKGDVLCIIEAMKLMNEIESDYSGKIKKILVKDGEAVDYGKELFIIEE